MMTVERILCPIDFSLDSNRALSYAAALSRAFDAELLVFHCAKEAAPAASQNRPGISGRIKEMVGRSVDLQAGASGAPKLNWRGVVADGDNPAEAITRQAREQEVDLIVMCSRRRPLRAALLGSTAEAVCRTAPCPVLVTHPDGREWVGGTADGIDLKRVLVAHDFSDCSEVALSYGLSLSQEYQSELHLLHVLSTPLLSEPELAWTPSSIEGSYHKSSRRLQKAIPGEAYLWCKVKQAVRWGKPYGEVLSYAKENGIDLICMGAHGTGFGMEALFGSNVDRVIRQSRCPVLVARPLGTGYFAPVDVGRGLYSNLIL